MKILWLSSITLPSAQKKTGESPITTGGWINTMINQLQMNDNITHINIVSPFSGKQIESIRIGKVIHTRVPTRSGVFKYDPKLSRYLSKVIDDTQPDIIDVQGIEFFLVRSLLEVPTDVPIVATIQGLTSECFYHYNAGIQLPTILKHITLRNFLFRDGLFSGRTNYKKRGQNEIEVLKQLKYVLGRTDWDKTYTLSTNKHLQYFHCGRILRDPFYETQWNLNAVERHSLFTTQARYPIKGLHVLLEAIHLLKPDFPDIKLRIAGKNLLQAAGFRNKITFSDYQRYIRAQINRLRLNEQIEFTGFLKDADVAMRLSKTHVFVIPSSIENSPNALGEAQMVGTPSVGSYVGGIPSYIDDNQSGLLYSPYEPTMLAQKIREIFEKDQLALKLSEGGRDAAKKRHDKRTNAQDLYNAYVSIISKEKR